MKSEKNPKMNGSGRLCTWAELCILAAAATVLQACDIGAPLAKCGKGKCEVYNSRGMWDDGSACTATALTYPKNEAELLAAVADAVRTKEKIKVISPLAHSRPPLMCPGGDPGTGLLISTRDLVRTHSVDAAAGTVTVDAGVNMRQVHDAVAAEGMALTTSTSWEGVSMAGGISTGAHGSGLRGTGSNIHDYVVGIRIVVPASPAEGYAKVVSLSRDDADFKAAVLSLGVLGAISQVTFALEPMFKRSVSLSLDDDAGLEDRLVQFLNATAFANIDWYASQGRALMGRIDRVPANASGNGINKSSYQPSTAAEVHASAENAHRLQKTQDSAELCNSSRNTMINRFRRGAGFLNTVTNFTGFPVVGFNHKMANTGGCEKFGVPETQKSCLPDRVTDSDQSVCTWDRRVGASRNWDFEFRVPLRLAADAMRDVKAIRDHGAETRSAFCFYEGNGIVMRTLKKSEAYLGPPEDMVTFELGYYRPDRPRTPAWKMDVLTEIEQILHEKYGAHLHWGKSSGYYIDGQARRATVSLEKFLDVRRRFDPDGVFLNEWSEKVLGLGGKRVQEIRDGCALEKLCKCWKDSHCAPSEGYFCLPGRVYTRARVCRKD